MFVIEVQHFEQWRQHARELLKRRVLPEHVVWQSNGQTEMLLGNGTESLSPYPCVIHELRIPKAFFNIAENVACYRDESRWSLLYSVAWRLIFESRKLLNSSIDPQVNRLLSMNKTIGRDKHKMEAFVRFKRIAYYDMQTDPTDNDKQIKEKEHFVAWFEPEHPILPLKMPFFIKRFNNMNWSILTPDLCAHWHNKNLSFSEGIAAAPRVDDELENLWLAYYKNIFNPARLKLKAMQAEMPKKYWTNLPEARLIKELTRGATVKMEKMIESDGVNPWNKMEKSKFIREKRSVLRTLT